MKANASLYARIAVNLREAGYASADIAKVTETTAKALTLSGASSAEAAAATLQLSQSLGSGLLCGEELNSIMENEQLLARLLASGLGNTRWKIARNEESW
ncbi:MAG: tape measure protein [Symbiopectobacterium sp.]